MAENASDDVSLLMEKLGFHEDAEILRTEHVSMRILRKMEIDDFMKIGITFGHSFEIREALQNPMQFENNEHVEGTYTTDDGIDLERSSDVVSEEDSEKSSSSPPSSVQEKIKPFKERERRQIIIPTKDSVVSLKFSAGETNKALKDMDKCKLKVSDEDTNESSTFSGHEKSKSVHNFHDCQVEDPDKKIAFLSASVREKIKPIPRLRKNIPKKRSSSDVQISKENSAILPDSSVKEEIKPFQGLDSSHIILSELGSDKSYSSFDHEETSIVSTRGRHQVSDRGKLASQPNLVPEKISPFQKQDRKEMQISDEDRFELPRPSVRERIRTFNSESNQIQVNDKYSDIFLYSSAQVNNKPVCNRESRQIQFSAGLNDESKSAAHESINPVHDLDILKVQVSNKDSEELTPSSFHVKPACYLENQQTQVSDEKSEESSLLQSFLIHEKVMSPYRDDAKISDEDRNKSSPPLVREKVKRGSSQIHVSERASGASLPYSVRQNIELFDKREDSEVQVSPTQDTEADEFVELGDEVRIVLLGKTGSGKSASGNTILGGDRQFEASSSASSVTVRCKLGKGKRFNKNIIVIDTPGLFDTSNSNEEIQSEIARCIALTAPGPHAFILVLGLTRFTKEDYDAVAHFIKHFGEKIYDYFILLFTRKDDLTHENKTLEDHLEKVPKELKKIVQNCGKRCVAFDNRVTGSKQEEQVKYLLKMIKENIVRNGKQYYTNFMYVEATKMMKEREDEIKKEYEEKRRRELNEMRKEIETTFKWKMEKQQALLADSQEKYKNLFDIFQKKQNEYLEFKNSVCILEKRIAEQKESYSEETKILREQLNSKLDTISQANQTMSKLEKSLKDLESKKDEYSKEISCLKKENESKCDELNTLKKQQNEYEIEKKAREEAREQLEKNKSGFRKTWHAFRRWFGDITGDRIKVEKYVEQAKAKQTIKEDLNNESNKSFEQ